MFKIYACAFISVVLLVLQGSSAVPFPDEFNTTMCEYIDCDVPFPVEFNTALCEYIDCLEEILNAFEKGKDYGKRSINNASKNAEAKIREAITREDGSVYGSLWSLFRGTQWLHEIEKVSKRAGISDGEDFGVEFGKAGSICAITLLDEMIGILSDAGYLRDRYLKKIPKKLTLAVRFSGPQHNQKSIKKVAESCYWIERAFGKELPMPNC